MMSSQRSGLGPARVLDSREAPYGGPAVAWSLVLAVALAVSTARAQDRVPAAAQSAAAPSEPSGNPVTGKKLYTDYYCYACHGTEGQGGRDGARIAPNPRPFDALRAYVRKPSGNMPPYTSRVVSDQELADIYAFLKTIQPPPTLKSLPLLNQ